MTLIEEIQAAIDRFVVHKGKDPLGICLSSKNMAVLKLEIANKTGYEVEGNVTKLFGKNVYCEDDIVHLLAQEDE